MVRLSAAIVDRHTEAIEAIDQNTKLMWERHKNIEKHVELLRIETTSSTGMAPSPGSPSVARQVASGAFAGYAEGFGRRCSSLTLSQTPRMLQVVSVCRVEMGRQVGE